MAKINFQTDSWGNKPDHHHIEFEVNGKTLMVTIDDNHIEVIGSLFNDTNNDAVNAWRAIPAGSKFNTMREYYENNK